jgi:hypothetical protein
MGVISEGAGVNGDEDGSGDGCRSLCFLARCRVTRGSETVGFLRVEGSLTGQVSGG